MGEELPCQVVEVEGLAQLKARRDEQLVIDWSASQCKVFDPYGSQCLASIGRYVNLPYRQSIPSAGALDRLTSEALASNDLRFPQCMSPQPHGVVQYTHDFRRYSSAVNEDRRYQSDLWRL